MAHSPRFRSLLAQSFLWIVLPLALITFGLVVAGVLAYQQVVTSLLADRDRQLAIISASRVSEDLADYARALETLATHPDFPRVPFQTDDVQDGNSVGSLIQLFDMGLVLVDGSGEARMALPAGSSTSFGDISDGDYLLSARESGEVTFSDVIQDAGAGTDMVVIAYPFHGRGGRFEGALLGGVSLHTTTFGDPLRRLRVGDEGFAYMVDRKGHLVFHPDESLIGADFSQRPFVGRVIAGESGGFLWEDPNGVLLVLGYAPVDPIGWGLVVREPWETVVSPVRTYGLLAGAVLLLAYVGTAFLLWQGVRRITSPIRVLDAQTRRLAEGEAVAPIRKTGIHELDALSQAFEEMAAQIASYRSGLRSYLGAVTKSQEDERLRLALELHDVTTQSLLAIARRVELLEAAGYPTKARAKLAEINDMIEDAIVEVREISQDLRPMVLEDLGLIPALRALMDTTRSWESPKPTVRFLLEGVERELPASHELALYRITQEALSNIRKHAAARRASVKLAFEERGLRLEISDDGKGFRVPPSFAELAQDGHFGLLGMQERAWAIGGTLRIESQENGGTRLRVILSQIEASSPEQELAPGV